MPLTLEIVTAERVVLQDDNIDMVIAPIGGRPGGHPAATMRRSLRYLEIGELRVKKGADEQSIVVAGGFLEVLDEQSYRPC